MSKITIRRDDGNQIEQANLRRTMAGLAVERRYRVSPWLAEVIAFHAFAMEGRK